MLINLLELFNDLVVSNVCETFTKISSLTAEVVDSALYKMLSVDSNSNSKLFLKGLGVQKLKFQIMRLRPINPFNS